MKVIAKIKVLFLILGILFILFGAACIGSKSYLEDFRKDVKKKGVSGITRVEYIGGTLSYDDFMDRSKEDIDTLGAAGPVCIVLGVGGFVLFGFGEAKAKKLKKEQAQ